MILPKKEIEEFFLNQKQSFGVLYSALSKKNSYIFYDELESIKTKTFEDFSSYLKNNSSQQFFGFISYEAKDLIEKTSSPLFAHIYVDNIFFKSFKKTVKFHGDIEKIISTKVLKKNTKFKVKKFESNFTDSSYLKAIDNIKTHLKNGDLYQANLTRKYYGVIENLSNPFALFLKLTKLNPNDYSGFLKFDDLVIISSSPELFLNIDEDANAISEPIKGTFKKNLLSKKNFKSVKEKAENLMIVDLMRNDFSKVCEKNSVKVKDLFKLKEYKNLAHLSSQITGKLAKGKTNVDLIKGCFPPGSMTGTPKIMATDICSQLEAMQRGVYSGILGTIKGVRYANFSVVIRTLILKKTAENTYNFELQSGGGIIYDSNPWDELLELKLKIKPLMKLLNIKKY